ncbi:MAG: inositol monophosphatase family protein [Defluviitaleaceae bacterium]|nr:inositol monophosphatase family protein [Defluviitaleaceae bacterium]
MASGRFESAAEWIMEAGKMLSDAAKSGQVYRKKTGHQDLVTDLDRQVEVFFRERIVNAFPGDIIVGEELGAGKGERLWYIDPIDGTTNFISIGRNYAISVAYYEFDKPRFGLVLDVAANELYCAQAEEGAFCNGISLAGRKQNKIEDSVLYTPVIQHTFLAEHPHREVMLYLSERVRAVRSLGSVALEMCYLAAGRGDMFAAMFSGPWDHNAARLILEEAGGVVGTLDGSALPIYAQSSVMACSNRELWDLMAGEFKKRRMA